MTIVRKLRVTVLLLVIQAGIAFSDNGGSAYSRYWFGDLEYVSDGRTMAMGGAGLAVLSATSLDRNNPASWSRINTTRFSVNLLYEGFSATDNAQSAYLSSADFDGFMFAIPISVPSGIVLSAGITPFSRVNYNITTPGSAGGLDYTIQYVGSGGLSEGHVGLSANVGSDLSIGSKLNYYFGTLNHAISQTFSSTDYTSSTVDRAVQLRGTGFTFGAVWTGLKKLLGLPQSKELSVAGIFTTTSYLTETDQRFFTFQSGSLTTLDTTSSDGGHMRMPYALGGGISYSSDRLLLAGDVYYQHWSQIDGRGINPDEIRDSYRFSAGCEILPKRDQSLPALQKLTYRFGIFYNESYYRIAGTPINEVGFTGGIGIPILRETSLNIAAQYSLLGTTDMQLQRQKVVRVLFTLSGGEPWFVRPEEEQ